ncbi:hypothetical protein [Photobacterium leiognathi]|uniref:hypothetical protein n=1 Tax=Photobacterium leiognathi TaxID=553611 RepID=UPI0027395D97|nr:hypothetical protein [Photobacterium leiognathi]
MSVKILDKNTIVKQNSDGFTPLIIGDPATIFQHVPHVFVNLLKTLLGEIFHLLRVKLAQLQAQLAGASQHRWRNLFTLPERLAANFK